MAFQRTTTEILADLTAARTARSALIAGEKVEEVSDAGGRMKLSILSMKEINSMIAELEREYQQAVSVEASRPRRHAIGTYF